MAKLTVKSIARQALRDDNKQRQQYAKQGFVDGARVADGFVNFAHKMGVGADNALSTASYSFNPLTRNRTLLEWMYRGSWVAGMAVDVIADDMTRNGIDWQTELPPQQIETVDNAVTRLQLWSQLSAVIRWARLYGGAIGVVMIDGQDMRTPLNLNSVGPGQFRGLLCLDRWQCDATTDDLVTDMGPSIGLPRFYRVNSSAPCLRGQAIHYTRVAFRLVGVALPYQQMLMENMWGLSVLERLDDRLKMFDSATAGAGQLVYKSYLRTLKVKNLRNIVSTGGKALQGLYAYGDNMRRFQNIEGLSMIDADDELEAQSHSAFSGLADALQEFGKQLSGALGIPLTRLFGQSPGGLNATGDSDMAIYNNTIAQQQNQNLREGVQLCYDLTARSAGSPLPAGTNFAFRSLLELDEPQKAEVASKVTTAVVSALEAGLISPRTAMQELRTLGRNTGVFTNITQEDIAKAETEINPPLPPMEGVGALAGQVAANNAADAANDEEDDGQPVRPQADAKPVRDSACHRVSILRAAPAGGADGGRHHQGAAAG